MRQWLPGVAMVLVLLGVFLGLGYLALDSLTGWLAWWLG